MCGALRIPEARYLGLQIAHGMARRNGTDTTLQPTEAETAALAMALVVGAEVRISELRMPVLGKGMDKCKLQTRVLKAKFRKNLI
jgi:hypothetical protein